MNQSTTITIDAKGKVLGRLASEIAFELMGKNSVRYAPNVVTKSKIVVRNAADVLVTGTKMQTKEYHHHSGYLGGLKTEKFAELFIKNPATVLRRAVQGMLPRNRLHKDRMSQLIIHAH